MSFYAFLSIWSQQYPWSALFNRLFTFNKRVSEEIKIFQKDFHFKSVIFLVTLWNSIIKKSWIS